MPNPIIRDGFVGSKKVDALSDWGHRVYSNLLVKADDAGRFLADAEFLRSQLFPLGISRRLDDFKAARTEIESVKLIILYEWAGTEYLQMTNVQRRGQAKISKFPWRDGDFKIQYVERTTRDGKKDFVATSLLDPIGIPSVSHTNAIDRDIGSPPTKTETNDGDGDDDGGDSSSGADEELDRQARAIAVAFGIEHRCGPVQFGDIRGMLKLRGVESVTAAMKVATDKGIGCPACISYASKIIASEVGSNDSVVVAAHARAKGIIAKDKANAGK